MTAINLNPKYPSNLNLDELERIAELEGNELALRIAQAASDSESVDNLCTALGEAYDRVAGFLDALHTLVSEHWQVESMLEYIHETVERADGINIRNADSNLSYTTAEMDEHGKFLLQSYFDEKRSDYERDLKAAWLTNILIGTEAERVKDTLIDARKKINEIDTMPNFWDKDSEFMNPFETKEERELRHNPKKFTKRGKKK